MITPFWQDPVYSVSLEGKHLLLDQNRLRPQANYTVDVKTKMCPGNLYLGPWSEWSSTAKWRTTGTTGPPESEGGVAMYLLAGTLEVIGISWWYYLYFCCGFKLRFIIQLSGSFQKKELWCLSWNSVPKIISFFYDYLTEIDWRLFFIPAFVLTFVLLVFLSIP